MSMMYKPLSLVISKTSSNFERKSLFKSYSLVSNDESRNNTGTSNNIFDTKLESAGAQHRTSHVIIDDHASRESLLTSRTTKNGGASPSSSKPRCIKSYQSDRMAIYDEQGDTFHAYSVIEAISQPGLSFQEAVDWVDDRLVLVGNGMTPGNFTVAMSLILASWVVAILLIAAFVKLIF